MTQEKSTSDKEDIPATADGSGQGGTSQPGPPTDPDDLSEGNVDFETPADGSTGTENTGKP